MKSVAFIPARGGSKGLPGKNIRMLSGKPLIAWSIEQALASDRIDRVIVSTDCEDIAVIARQYGAEVPFIRPKEISGDEATTESAMMHCCTFLLSDEYTPDIFILIQPTSPIRKSGQIDSAIDYFIDNNKDSLLTVVKSHKFIWKDIANPIATYDYVNRPRRQDIEKMQQGYLETGSFYITKFEYLIKYENRLCGNIGLFETSEEESYEIDSLIDFNICEMIISKMGEK